MSRGGGIFQIEWQFESVGMKIIGGRNALDLLYLKKRRTLKDVSYKYESVFFIR